MTAVWDWYSISSRGKHNGLSSTNNDGADFGPDTKLGATATGQYGPPYTLTSGIQEAIDIANTNYTNNNAPQALSLGDGTFVVQPTGSPPTYTNTYALHLSVPGLKIVGRGYGRTVIQPAQYSGSTNFTDAIKKDATVPRLILEDFAVDCNNNPPATGSSNGINLSDSSGLLQQRVHRVEIEHYTGTGLILDGNGSSHVWGCLIENPYSGGAGFSFASGGAASIDKSYVAGNIDVLASTFSVRDSAIGGIRFVNGATNTARLENCYWNTSLDGGSSSMMIDTDSSSVVDELRVANCYFDFTKSAGIYMITGSYTDEVFIEHCISAIPNGTASNPAVVTVLPSAPSGGIGLTSHFASTGVYARFHIVGGEYSYEQYGIQQLFPSPHWSSLTSGQPTWNPGVILAEAENFGRQYFGNQDTQTVNAGQSATVNLNGGTQTSPPNLPFARYPGSDANYMVLLEKQSSGDMYVSSKTSTSFALTNPGSSAVTAAWKILHLGV